MLKYIEEYAKYVEITGFRNVKIDANAEFFKAIRKQQQNTAVQFFDAELVATWQHLYFAVLNALMAFGNKRNISRNIAVEVMLYASAQRQIRKAIDLMGVKCDLANVAVVIVGESPSCVKSVLSAVSKRISVKPDETVLSLSKEKMLSIRRAFGISEKEMETVLEKNNAEQALVDMVVERVALLSTQL